MRHHKNSPVVWPWQCAPNHECFVSCEKFHLPIFTDGHFLHSVLSFWKKMSMQTIKKLMAQWPSNLSGTLVIEWLFTTCNLNNVCKPIIAMESAWLVLIVWCCVQSQRVCFQYQIRQCVFDLCMDLEKLRTSGGPLSTWINFNSSMDK